LLVISVYVMEDYIDTILFKQVNPITLEFHWDNGGDIHEGTYDAVVNIAGIPNTGTIKNLELDKGTAYNLYLSFNAAKIDIPLI